MRYLMLVLLCMTLAAFGSTLTRLHPPGQLTIAAGPADGAYARTAEKYARILARDKIKLKIVETEGSVENAHLLANGTVDAAFLQGGVAVPGNDVEAIGAIFFEPILFLIRSGSNISQNPAKWNRLSINSGAVGSGTEAAFRDFERVVGLAHSDNIHLDVPYDEAVEALLAGRLDIATFVAPLNAPYLTAAYSERGLRLLAVDHADAISRRLAYANLVTIPSGGLLLDPVTPAEARQIIALEARLAVNSKIHPALVNRLTMAAIELHRRRGILSEADSFPSIKGTGLPVNNTARQLIQEGPSTWHDWLPYWIAAQINRVFLLFLPFVLIVLPVLRLVPAAYAYLMRRRVWRHYPEIRKIEDEISKNPDLQEIKVMQNRLSELEERLSGMLLPVAYRQRQYDARLHLQLVQKRIAELQNAQ